MATGTSDAPVLIIGAGIGGLATAIALQQAGFPVRVFERVEELKEVGAGLTLWANAVRVMQNLGLNEMLHDLGMPVTDRGGLYTDRGKLLSLLTPINVDDQTEALTVVVHRAEFLAALQEQVGRDTIQLGTQLLSFEQDEEGVTAHFADGNQVRGCLLIGADGIHSSVRQQLYPQSTPRYAGYTAWRGVTSFATLQRIGEFWGRGMRFGIAPLTRERFYWFAARNAPEHEHEKPEEQQKHLLTLFKGWYPEIPTLIEATPSRTILRNDIYDVRPLPHWAKGRVALLGDAAHAMTPNLGQGACQALEDAYVLAHTLQQAHTIPEALHHYQQKRRARANMVVNRSRQIGIVAQWEQPFACWLRDHLLMLTPPHLLNKQIEQFAK